MRNRNISSEGQCNSEILLGLLKNRLQSSGKAKAHDEHGNIIFIDCDIYAKDVLEAFIELSISEFNQTPHFTDFTLENSRFVDCFAEVLVEGATLYALSSKALIERGREFMIKDDGVHFAPPAVSEMLNTQFSTLLSHHWDKLKVIKSSIKEFNK
jgi:hypothetical protein